MNDAHTERERTLIASHGDLYRALNGGRWQPEDPEEARFVEVCRGRAAPEAGHEVAFVKYVRLVRAQSDSEAARKAAEAAAQQNVVEEEPGQRRYPARLNSTFDSAGRGLIDDWD